MEYLALGSIGLGGLLALIGWIWLVYLGFREGGAVWGILIFLFTGLAGIVFVLVKKTGWVPLAMLIIGSFIAGIGMVPMVMRMMEQYAAQ